MLSCKRSLLYATNPIGVSSTRGNADRCLSYYRMKAWGEQLDPAQQTQIRFLGDPAAEFTKSMDLDWDATGPFGGVRGKRYALKVVDGKVTEAHVEPDNAGFNGRLTSCWRWRRREPC